MQVFHTACTGIPPRRHDMKIKTGPGIDVGEANAADREALELD